MTGGEPVEVAADDQVQAEMRLGVSIFYPIFKSIARAAPDLLTAKRQAVEALARIDEQTPWTVSELIHALVETFAMLYKTETSGAPAPAQHEKGSSDA